MARVTVEDCVVRVPNRFELVMLAAQRARNLGAGAPLTVERDADKNPVVALREIADLTVNLKELEGALIRGLQKMVESDEPEADELDLLAMSQPAEAAEEDAVEEDVREDANDDEEMLEDDLQIEEEEGGARDDEEAGTAEDDDGKEEQFHP